MSENRKSAAEARRKRLAQANELLIVIAHCGRRFFYHLTRVSRFEVDERGRIWLIDKYTEKRVYTHYSGRWRGFSDGGTLRHLLECLRDYIQHGTPLSPGLFGPWPQHVCNGDLWGYGADMQKVRDAASRLGVVEPMQEAASA